MNHCHDCQHFARFDLQQGHCRRYPPVPLAINGGVYSHFPLVLFEATCGEFKQKENEAK